MAIKKDKPRALGELLPKLEGRASASAAAWQQHIEKHARRGESWAEADARLRREKEKGRANPTEEQEKETAETPAKLFLPGFDIGAFPNHLNRSSLFAPVARGKRKFHRQEKMVSRSDCILEYTGEQLDEADADLLMALIDAAISQPLGSIVLLNRAEILRKIGRSKSKQSYQWMHRRIKSMTEATLFLEARKPNGKAKYKIGSTKSFRIISSFEYNEENENYGYILDPRWVVIYSNKEYSLIDWDKRLQIGSRQDMAKTLQRLIATSSDNTQRYSLQWLKEKMEYSSPIRKFKEALASACNELKRVEIIINWKIEDSKQGQEQLMLKTPEIG